MLQHQQLRPMDITEIGKLVRVIPDFPKPGILFRDIAPLLRHPEAFDQLISRMSAVVREMGADVVFGMESRGFLFGVPIARELGLPFVPVRKPGKLPGETVEVEYGLEYGSGKLQIQADAIRPGARVAVVDDLLATGGTAVGAAALAEKLGGKVVGAVFAIELSDLGGRKRLQFPRTDSILTF